MAATSLELEREKQRRWRLRAEFAQITAFDELVVNEFRAAEEQEARQARALQAIVRYAGNHVPHYREVFWKVNVAPEDIRQAADLACLPVLTRGEVGAKGAALRARALPAGEQWGGGVKSSGTTGEPVHVEFTKRSNSMFTLLKQRGLRWNNVDPQWKAATIYSPRELPRLADGALARDGATAHKATWPHVGKYFETGAFVGLDAGCGAAQQIAWLDEQQPNYVNSLSANLEQLALAWQERARPAYLRALNAIAQQLTPAMRRTIERVLQVPLGQTFGFNEIGIVATECPEGGRFHVHSEHCLVEIIGADGKPAAPGEFGRMLVTGLTNAAMPLLRYDPDDLAMATSGPCACGRTLPSFGAVQGRYRRMAFLPPGVWRHWLAIQRAHADMPPELLAPLRQYQVHHHRDGRFVLRLVLAAPLQPGYHERLRTGWAAANREVEFPLEVLEVPEIRVESGRKFLDFTSDLVPAPDWEPPPVSVVGVVAPA